MWLAAVGVNCSPLLGSSGSAAVRLDVEWRCRGELAEGGCRGGCVPGRSRLTSHVGARCVVLGLSPWTTLVDVHGWSRSIGAQQHCPLTTGYSIVLRAVL